MCPAYAASLESSKVVGEVEGEFWRGGGKGGWGKVWRNRCVGERLWKMGRWGRRVSSESVNGRTLEVGDCLEKGALWINEQ